MRADATQDPAALAAEVTAARDRLLSWAAACPDSRWTTALGDDDPRPVAVVLDHVADAYGYIGRWIEALVRGEDLHVDGAVVDDLNARHAAGGTPSRAEVVAHLVGAGDRLVALVAGLSPADVGRGDGRVARLATIAALHADGHREELEACLA